MNLHWSSWLLHTSDISTTYETADMHQYPFRVCVAVFLVFAAMRMANAQGTPVFGLPLGGKMQGPIRQCPINSNHAKAICWVGKPFVDASGTQGFAHLPNAKERPSWAEFVMFQLGISSAGLLESIGVETTDSTNHAEISRSISARFGSPQVIFPLYHPLGYTLVWDTDKAYIKMICWPEKCWISFITPESRAAALRRAEEHRRAQAAKPRSP